MSAPDIVACTAQHTLVDGEVHLLGAVETVTGAMTRVELGGCKLLIDCGVAQGLDARNYRMPEAAKDVDAVLLTHGHLDHIGSLPELLDSGYDKPIFATQATLDITRISLDDALRMRHVSDAETERLRLKLNRLCRPIAYDKLAEHLPSFRGSFAFREAGHILGSASIDLRTAKSRLLFSGDLGRPNSPILRDACTDWGKEPPVDLVVMESTYGDRQHEHTHADVEKRLEEIINDAARRKARVLVPAFAIGRTQVLLWFLNHLLEQKRIPQVPVVLDTPMGALVTQSYEHSTRLFDAEALAQLARGDDPLDFESLYVAKRGADSAQVRDMPGPLIVIAGSGMCTGGRIVGHLSHPSGLPNPETTVLFVGHQSVGTPGRRMQDNHGGTVWLEGKEVPVRARLETLRGLSAHADRDELLAWLSHVPNVKRVGLHHGEAAAQRALVEYAHQKWQAA